MVKSYDFGHTDQLFQQVDLQGNVIGYDYLWFDQNGVQIASSDEDYRRLHFGELVNIYNANELAKIGEFTYISSIAALDYYFYRKNI